MVNMLVITLMIYKLQTVQQTRKVRTRRPNLYSQIAMSRKEVLEDITKRKPINP